MEERSEFLHLLRKEVSAIRKEAQRDFYFLEEEDLKRKPSPKKWSISEVFAHINLVNAFYLKQTAQALNQAPDVNHDHVKVSWLGKKLKNGMEPDTDTGKITFKVPTLSAIDPVKRAKKGIALDEKVIFRDFVNDMDEWEELLIKAYDKDIDQIKVKSLFPFLKLRLPDALPFIMAHTRRHLQQARNNL